MNPDTIVYLRARIASVPEDFAGRRCVTVEPVTKGGRPIADAWPFTVPVDWLVTLEEARNAMQRRGAACSDGSC